MSPTSTSAGVMNMTPLIGKLTLMGDKHKMLKEAQEQVLSLVYELDNIKPAVEKIELVDELNPVARKWRDDIREMSQNIENRIDELMGNHEGFIKKTSSLGLKRLGKRHQIAAEIEQLKNLAMRANDERVKNKIDDYIHSSSGFGAADPEMSVIYKKATREELVSCLADNEEELKVVSILGFGGLGKTTLAKEVYDEIGRKFIYKAFVSVSRNPDMTRLLNSLQLQLGMDSEVASSAGEVIEGSTSCAGEVIEDESSPPWKMQHNIAQLREYLSHKRYIIVIDDLWDELACNIISSIFANDGNGSRVIVTTRVDDVALAACQNNRKYIYRMKALKEQDSRRLFFKTIFGSEDGCPPELEQVSDEILKKCFGFPNEIINIANLLARHKPRSSNAWEGISDSLDTNFAANLPSEEVTRSYKQLPLHLRACLLYLGMYPEDQEVKKDDLARQWIAESFVSTLHQQDLEDTAKIYFNELINRDMIQAKRTNQGEVLSCTVNSLMHEFILERCEKHNFVHVADGFEDIATMHDLESFKVSRLSLQSSGASDKIPAGTIANGLLLVRSLALFGESTSILLSCKYVRVLIVEIPLGYQDTDKITDLTVINQLLKLRYLKVSAQKRIKLLEIQGLEHLETLELDCMDQLRDRPYIAHLPHLSRLILPKHCRVLPEGIGNMEALHTLHWFDVGNQTSKDITALGKLTRLTYLRISNHTMCPLATEVADALASSIGKLTHLRYLHIDGWNESEEDQLTNSLSLPCHLELKVLDLTNCLITRLPKWIGDLCGLCRLNLRVWKISPDEVRVLGNLPSLVDLYLWAVCFAGPGRAIVAGRGSFPALQHLELRSRDDVTACLEFEAGAMTELRELTLRFDGQHWGGATPAGMEHLLRLQQIRLHKFPGQDHISAAKSAFSNATQVHPNLPSFTISG